MVLLLLLGARCRRRGLRSGQLLQGELLKCRGLLLLGELLLLLCGQLLLRC